MSKISAVFSLFAAAFALLPGCLLADNLRIAVASNFASVLDQLAVDFEQQSGHDIDLIPGATGRHYAQIINGAPFDLLLAADAVRPRLLEESSHAVAGSRFTYALGKLVLWSAEHALVDKEGEVLTRGNFRHLALANPRLAPYGAAAREVLDGMGVWDKLQGRLVQGENISQTLQFVQSGNAELGFIAYSQWLAIDSEHTGSVWAVPAELHTPLEQQAVVLRDSAAARAFTAYLQSPEVQEQIRAAGYELP